MVRKYCKHGLNTGNTIRRTDHVTARIKYQYLKLQPINVNDYYYDETGEADYDEGYEDVLHSKRGQTKLAKNYPKLYQTLGKPGEGVEYSTSKKKRWLLQSKHLEDIQSEIYPAEHKTDLIVHKQNIKYLRRYYEDRVLDKDVREYYSNSGPVQDKQSTKQSESLRSIMLPENRPTLKKGLASWEKSGERRKEFKYLSGTKTWLQLHVFKKCPLTSKVLSNRGHSKVSYHHQDRTYQFYDDVDWSNWAYDEWVRRGLRLSDYRNSIKRRPADLSEICEYLSGEMALDDGQLLADEPLIADSEDEYLTENNRRTEFTLKEFIKPIKTEKIRYKKASYRCKRQCLPSSHKDNKVSLSEPIPPVFLLDVTDSVKIPAIEISPTLSEPCIEFTPLANSVIITLKRKSRRGVGGYKELKREYGEDYQEAYTSPRLFNIRLFHHVYVVFHQLTEDSDLFRVHLTGDLDGDNITSYINFVNNNTYTTELKHLIKRLRRKIRCKNTPTSNGDENSVSKKSSKESVIYSNLDKWSTTSEKFVSYTEELVSKLISYSEMNLRNQKSLEDDYLVIPNWYQRSKSMITECGICFETLSPTTAHISLLPCKHSFCNDCWSYHIQSQMSEGITELICPEYKCNGEASPVVIRSFVSYHLYKKWMERSADRDLQRDELKTYCSNKRCDFVLGIKGGQQSREPIFMSCECKTYKCMGCDQEPHWPVPCELLEKYRQCLQNDGLLSWKDLASSQLITDKFVRCPKCRTPIERTEGCPHMSCTRCQANFCWNCGGFYDSHDWSTECSRNNVEERYVGDSENLFYKTAVRHRYLTAVNKENLEILTRTKSIVKTISMSAYKKFLERGEEIRTITENIEQMVRFCFHLHQLLENIYAFNFTNKSSVFVCYRELSALEFSLETIDGLFNMKITLKIYNKMMKYFDDMKNLTNSIIETYSKVYYPTATPA